MRFIKFFIRFFNAEQCLRILSLVFLFSCSKPRLGVMYNQDGEQSSLDIPSLRGVELAMKNQKRFDLVVKNSNSDLKRAKKEAREIAPDVFAFIGYSDTDMVRAAASQALEKVFLTSGATSPNLPRESSNVYLVCFSDNEQAAAAAKFAYSHLGFKTVCILYEESMEYTLGLSKYFQEHFKGSILSIDSYSEKHLDISKQLAKIAELRPDFIYIASGPEEAPFLVEKIRAYDLTQPIFGGDSFDTFSFTRNPQMDEIYFSTHVFLDPESKDPLIRNFFKAFKDQYQEVEPTAFAALGYDTLNLIADVVKRAGTYDALAIRKELQSTRNFKGVTGEITYLDGSHIPLKPVTIVQVLQGKPSQAARFVP